jgi:hypothetical protein
MNDVRCRVSGKRLDISDANALPACASAAA